MRDEYAKESLTHCVECGTLKWIHDSDAGTCTDCLEAIDRTRRPPVKAPRRQKPVASQPTR